MRSVEERVIEVVALQMGIKEDECKIDSSFISDLGADSLDVVELTMALEQEFKIEISDEDSEKLYTVGDCIRYIKEHLV